MKELKVEFYNLISGGIRTRCFCAYYRTPLELLEQDISQQQCEKYCCQERRMQRWTYTDTAEPIENVIAHGSCSDDIVLGSVRVAASIVGAGFIMIKNAGEKLFKGW